MLFLLNILIKIVQCAQVLHNCCKVGVKMYKRKKTGKLKN